MPLYGLGVRLAQFLVMYKNKPAYRQAQTYYGKSFKLTLVTFLDTHTIGTPRTNHFCKGLKGRSVSTC